MIERRQGDRHPVAFELEVYDTIAEEKLGKIADISDDGFMLFCPSYVMSDTIWSCKILTCPKIGDLTPIFFGADCMWTKAAGDDQHVWAGFHIIDISVEQHQKFLKIVSMLAT